MYVYVFFRVADVNKISGGFTALHLAVLHNRLTNVQLLIKHGAGAYVICMLIMSSWFSSMKL